MKQKLDKNICEFCYEEAFECKYNYGMKKIEFSAGKIAHRNMVCDNCSTTIARGEEFHKANKYTTQNVAY